MDATQSAFDSCLSFFTLGELSYASEMSCRESGMLIEASCMVLLDVKPHSPELRRSFPVLYKLGFASNGTLFASKEGL